MSAARSQRADAAWAERLARRHEENFSVLSPLLPSELRPHFAAVYAFCRTSDDLADATGNDDAARARSLQLLAEWRRYVDLAARGETQAIRSTVEGDPLAARAREVFVPLARTMREYRVPVEPFHQLLDAFEQDQRVRRYGNVDELVAYSRGSANPVGQIVLMLGGVRPPTEEPRNAGLYAMSDSICTALQLTNFWQDVRRDLFERDRVYLPTSTGVMAADLRAWMEQGGDPVVRSRYAAAIKPLLAQTRTMFEFGRDLPRLLGRPMGPVVELFAAGGEAVLKKMEANPETLWYRPRLGAVSMGWVMLRVQAAWASGRRSRRSEVGS